MHMTQQVLENTRGLESHSVLELHQNHQLQHILMSDKWAE